MSSGLNRIRAATAFSALMVASVTLSSDTRRFSDWADPVNLGPPVNSVLAEVGPELSRNGLSLYFTCLNCPGGLGGFDIWVSQREHVDAPWGAPRNLGPAVNSEFSEAAPELSTDGHELYFNSDRPGGFGGNDLYVSRRHNKRDDFGWRSPTNLGAGVNTAASEQQPLWIEDDPTGEITLYFVSNRPGGPGGDDIYISTLQPDDSFAATTLVEELSSPFVDNQPTLPRGGLEVIFASDRPGTFGNLDLWVSTRRDTCDRWSEPENLGPVVNTQFIDAGPALSFDGRVLFFQRPFDPRNVSTFFDIWVTSRTKLRKRD